jgi:hypothetical protein
VLAAVGEGRTTPSEAGEVMGLIEACRKNVAPDPPPARVFRVSFVSAREPKPRQLTFRETR